MVDDNNGFVIFKVFISLVMFDEIEVLLIII